MLESAVKEKSAFQGLTETTAEMLMGKKETSRKYWWDLKLGGAYPFFYISPCRAESEICFPNFSLRQAFFSRKNNNLCSLLGFQSSTGRLQL